MNIKKSLTIAALCLPSAIAAASPQDDVSRLLVRSKPAAVTFSDGGSAWTGQTAAVSRLDSGKAIIVQAKFLALDTDGASSEIRECDSTAQKDTALSGPKGEAVDANAVAYFVLPWCGEAANKSACKANPPYRQLGLQKGDLAAVVSANRLAFAIAADLGPEKHFGEGSVQLHRMLGHETVGKNPLEPQCAKNESSPSAVFIVAFPQSNDKWLPPEEIERKGRELWTKLLDSE